MRQCNSFPPRGAWIELVVRGVDPNKPLTFGVHFGCARIICVLFVPAAQFFICGPAFIVPVWLWVYKVGGLWCWPSVALVPESGLHLPLVKFAPVLTSALLLGKWVFLPDCQMLFEI